MWIGAVLTKAGKVYATASEDMDTLTFGATRLLRSFNNKKEPITLINLDIVLLKFEMTMEVSIASVCLNSIGICRFMHSMRLWLY